MVDQSLGEVTATSFLRGLRLAILGITVAVLTVLYVPEVIANASVYRPLVVEVGAYVVLGAVAAACGVLVVRDRPIDRWRWPLLVVVFAASAAATAAVPAPHLMGPAHGVYGLIGWFGVLLLLGGRLSILFSVLVAHNALTTVQLAIAGQTDLETFTDMAMKGVVDFAFQFIAGYTAFALRRIAESAAADSAGEERVRIEHAVGEELSRDRSARYAALAKTLVPLLRGLASGTHDPADQEVRSACAIEAARLRRLFAENEDAPDPLIHELQACISMAERNGVHVSLAIRGRRPALPTDIRRALTDHALAALVTATSQARVAVAGSPNMVQVSVVTDGRPRQPVADSVTQTRVRGVTVTETATKDRWWVEAKWQAND